MDSNTTSPTTPLADGYFSAVDTASTRDSSPSLTPSTQGVFGDRALPVLNRDIPKPTDELNIEEALNRKPGHWTVQGQIKRNRNSEGKVVASQQAYDLKVRSEMSDVKRELLELQKKLISFTDRQ